MCCLFEVFSSYTPHISLIRMRLAARAPPPPTLELGVCCSCLRSVDCKISIRCSMSAFLFAFNLCIFLKLFARSLGFPSIRFVPGGFGDLEIFLQKCVRFLSKMMPQSIKIHWKSIQNWSKRYPKGIRIRFRKQVGEMAATRLRKEHCFCTIWEILVAILGQAGRQGGPKIHHLGTKTLQKSEKWGPGRGLIKSLIFWMKFDG